MISPETKLPPVEEETDTGLYDVPRPAERDVFTHLFSSRHSESLSHDGQGTLPQCQSRKAWLRRRLHGAIVRAHLDAAAADEEDF